MSDKKPAIDDKKYDGFGTGLMPEGDIPTLSSVDAEEDAASRQNSDGGEQEKNVNMQILAEKIYMMLREELRVERERVGRNQYW